MHDELVHSDRIGISVHSYKDDIDEGCNERSGGDKCNNDRGGNADRCDNETF